MGSENSEQVFEDRNSTDENTETQKSSLSSDNSKRTKEKNNSGRRLRSCKRNGNNKYG